MDRASLLAALDVFRQRSARYPIVTDERGCWLWQGALRGGNQKHGIYKGHTGLYPSVHINGRLHYVHRLQLMLKTGDTEIEFAGHTCENPRCWNPAHLTDVTRGENNAAAAAKRLRGQATISSD